MNLAIGVSGLSICVLGLWLALGSAYLERRSRQTMIAIFTILTVYVLLDLLGQLADNHTGPGWVALARGALFFESLSSSVVTVLLTGFLLYRSGEDWRRAPVFRLAAALWAVYVLLLVYTQFSGTLYLIDDDNVYHRGPWYPALLVPVVLIMGLNLVALWRRREKLSPRERVAFAAYAAVPLAAMVVQMLFYGVYAIVLGSALAAMVMFVNIQNDQTERYTRQEAENSQLRVDIMLSQIQPHFLYNTLAVIQDLCHLGDSAGAEAATVKFARYLRGNMASIGTDAPVPFSQELEHTRGYMELEQMRFREKLTVRYDIQATEFLIPTLALQPMAENAVRHGVRGNPTGEGTVTLASREYPDRWEVTVSDDGPGFDPTLPPEEDGPHVGIENVRQRLERMCSGNLTVVSAPGEGTTVTISIPKNPG